MPAEQKCYALPGRVVALRVEVDGDLHIALQFRCGAEAGKDHCWCAELAHVMPVRGTGGRYCPECLKLEIGLRLRGTRLVTLQEA